MNFGQIFNWEQMNMKFKERIYKDQILMSEMRLRRYDEMTNEGTTSLKRVCMNLWLEFKPLRISKRHMSLSHSFTGLPHQLDVVTFSGDFS